ncbi:MAG: ATP-binding protein [Peptostreptococcaceae bacterium]|nr:ATP-binding protein [Peptostreptococcaceae bacterium]
MSKRESKILEFKSDISNSFLKTVSAYANYGTGKIIFGIDDSGETVGLKDLQENCLSIENKINDNIKPLPKYTLSMDKKSKTIILEVSEGMYKPYLYKNKAYKRNDTSTIEADRLEYNRLVLEGANQNYEELPSTNQNLTFSSLETQLKEKLGIEKVTMDIFKTLELFSEKNGYNHAAEILADNNSIEGLDIVRFGKNMDEFLERETMQGSILEQYEKAIALYKKNYQYEIIDGAQRQPREKIPEKAFREAVANAIVHRTWDTKVHIRILMHEDKIEIISPGGLMSGISEEEYLRGQISLLRNPILANVFFRLRYIEKFGTGIRRINYSYENSIIKPEYQIYENSITIILPLFDEEKEVLSADEKAIFDLLNGRSLSRAEIQTQSRMNKDKVIRILNNLIEKNTIQRIGTGRGTKYKKI